MDSSIPILFAAEDPELQRTVRKSMESYTRALLREKSVADGAVLVDFNELATRLGISVAKCRELHAGGIITARFEHGKLVRFHWPSVQEQLDRKANRLKGGF